MRAEFTGYQHSFTIGRDENGWHGVQLQDMLAVLVWILTKNVLISNFYEFDYDIVVTYVIRTGLMAVV